MCSSSTTKTIVFLSNRVPCRDILSSLHIGFSTSSHYLESTRYRLRIVISSPGYSLWRQASRQYSNGTFPSWVSYPWREYGPKDGHDEFCCCCECEFVHGNLAKQSERDASRGLPAVRDERRDSFRGYVDRTWFLIKRVGSFGTMRFASIHLY